MFLAKEFVRTLQISKQNKKFLKTEHSSPYLSPTYFKELCPASENFWNQKSGQIN